MWSDVMIFDAIVGNADHCGHLAPLARGSAASALVAARQCDNPMHTLGPGGPLVHLDVDQTFARADGTNS